MWYLSNRKISISWRVFIFFYNNSKRLGPDRYLDHLMPLLLQALQNSDEVEVCTAAIGTVGDITRVMQGKISKYCDQIITVVLKAMQDPALNRY